ncbi:hypothetical protein [Methylobacterium sp. SyP6R]|uniref:hypothetical protein n=1 Tax=Methylobacterium sp. SyP6R TaxID=2718876 RepID=UPI001F332DDF|nr:hypothetical protein [Methylobacterium sp. SyP6R]MCF4126973.1 hypothetical protein [Methylobacterium sp. SyP6R]
MKFLCLLLVLAATPALADACDEAGRHLADEVGDAYALRTGPIITVRRGRQSFHYTIECVDDRPLVVSGSAGYGFSSKMAEFRRWFVRGTTFALDIPGSTVVSAMDQCAHLARGHGFEGVETTVEALAVSCSVMHDAEEFEVRRR